MVTWCASNPSLRLPLPPSTRQIFRPPATLQPALLVADRWLEPPRRNHGLPRKKTHLLNNRLLPQPQRQPWLRRRRTRPSWPPWPCRRLTRLWTSGHSASYSVARTNPTGGGSLSGATIGSCTTTYRLADGSGVTNPSRTPLTLTSRSLTIWNHCWTGQYIFR